MASLRRAVFRAAISYADRLHFFERTFDEAKEFDDRPISLLGIELDKAQIEHSMSELTKRFSSTGDMDAAKLYMAYVDGGVEMISRLWPLIEQKTIYQSALDIAQQTVDKHAEFRYLNNLSMVLFDLGNAQVALQHCISRLTLAEELAEPLLIVKALDTLGNAYLHTDQLELALQFYKRLVPLAGEIGALDVLMQAFGNTGVIFHEQGLLKPALGFYQDALQMAETQKDVRAQFTGQLQIGHLYMDMHKYALAKSCYETAHQLAKYEFDLDLLLQVWNGLGNVCFALQQYPEARIYYEKCCQQAKDDNRLIAQCAAVGNLGNMSFKLLQYDDAIKCYQQQLTLASSIAFKEQIAAAHINLGLVYLQTGYPKLGKESVSIAKQIYDEREQPYPPVLHFELSILSLPSFYYRLYCQFFKWQSRLVAQKISKNA